MTRKPHRFSARYFTSTDIGFADLKGVARHIDRLRQGGAVQMTPCTLGSRGCTAPEAAVEINLLDADGNPHKLLGYAILDGLVGNRAAEALRRAMEPKGGRLLALDPDAAFAGAVAS